MVVSFLRVRKLINFHHVGKLNMLYMLFMLLPDHCFLNSLYIYIIVYQYDQRVLRDLHLYLHVYIYIFDCRFIWIISVL